MIVVSLHHDAYKYVICIVTELIIEAEPLPAGE